MRILSGKRLATTPGQNPAWWEVATYMEPAWNQEEGPVDRCFKKR
jgi:hypothetical protein